jgi:N-acetylglucosaminyldiphosphoundecaprenol N-acetyl-beta-D-mannosaminyltransferase
MIYAGKKDVLGVLVDIIDYEAAVALILEAAQKRTAFAVSALAVHGIMTGVFDPEQRYRLNQLDLIVPDGQPVRWALNLVHRAGLQERVYGPMLTLSLCQCAQENSIPIYFFGSTAGVLADLQGVLKSKFPRLVIAGAEQSRFRQLTRDEKTELVRRIQGSGAAIVFVGLGCPRQEVWAFEYRQALNMPILAVGAAFDFIAGNVRQAPSWMQDHGLEWLFRLCVEPRRLWRRYIYLNPAYLSLLALQIVGLYRPNPIGKMPIEEVSHG